MSTTPKKMDVDGLAAYYVQRRQAQGLNRPAMENALNGLILLKGALAEYDLYAAAERATVIRPDDVAELLPNGEWEKLRPDTRKALRASIRAKDAARLRGLETMMAFLREQCGHALAGSPAFQEAYQQQLDAYAPLPPAQRPARRAKATPILAF